MSRLLGPYLWLSAFTVGGCALLGYDLQEPTDAGTAGPTVSGGPHDGSVSSKPADAAVLCPGCAADGGGLPDGGKPPAGDCADGLRGAAESDVDCGGPDCDPCDVDAACAGNTDCVSDRCGEAGACCAAHDGSCDGVDDDCDGATDEDHASSSSTCGVGVCAGNVGVARCQSGVVVDSCDATAGAAMVDSSCDGADDDCDGVTDEDFVSSPTTCGVGGCAANTGTLSCVSGATVDTCSALAGAALDDASCDGADDDCDGATDEGFVPSPTACGVGGCASNTGTLSCVSGATVDTCDAFAGATLDDASCDGTDDDCDGATDEDFVSSPATCGVGPCAGNTGTESCQLGVLVSTCDALAGSSPEGPGGDLTCTNGIDEDCDGLVDDQDPNCWSASGWLYRKQVRLLASEVSADLSAFPVLISSTDSDLATHANANGSDIVFTAADGLTTLSHEVERYDAGTGELTAWVRVDNLSGSTDTLLYMYYGNSAAADQQDPTAVWNTDYRAVWHLGDDPDGGDAGDIRDSTANASHGRAAAGMTSSDLVAAKIGNGLDLDGNSDGVETSINVAEIPNASQYTLSMWMKANGNTGVTTVMAYSVDWGTSYAGIGHGLTSGTAGDPFLLHVSDDESSASIEGMAPVEDGGWHHLVATRDGDTFALYLDGALQASDVVPGVGLTTNTSMWLGLNPWAGGIQEFLGVLDEARVSATAHTQAWIETEYRNQSSPGTFMQFSPAETL